VTPELIETDRRPAKVVSIADLPAPEYGAQVSAAPGDYLAALTGAALLGRAGAVSIPLQKTYTLDQAADAHTASAEGHVTGCVIVTVS
jgi:hypothetical protein